MQKHRRKWRCYASEIAFDCKLSIEEGAAEEEGMQLLCVVQTKAAHLQGCFAFAGELHIEQTLVAVV